eukprot:981865-Rhodomonas_salina.2
MQVRIPRSTSKSHCHNTARVSIAERDLAVGVEVRGDKDLVELLLCGLDAKVGERTLHAAARDAVDAGGAVVALGLDLLAHALAELLEEDIARLEEHRALHLLLHPLLLAPLQLLGARDRRAPAQPGRLHARHARQHARGLDALAQRRQVREAPLLGAQDNRAFRKEARRDHLHRLMAIVLLERLPVHGQQLLHDRLHRVVQRHHRDLVLLPPRPRDAVGREQVHQAPHVQPRRAVKLLARRREVVAEELVRHRGRRARDQVGPNDGPRRGAQHHVKRVPESEVHDRARHACCHAASQPTALDRQRDLEVVLALPRLRVLAHALPDRSQHWMLELPLSPVCAPKTVLVGPLRFW